MRRVRHRKTIGRALCCQPGRRCSKLTMPNFIIIGAGKSGTTSLYDYLDQHPEIYVSPTKETNFFALEGQELNFQGPNVQERDNSWTITSLNEYRRQFAGVKGEKAVGEASPLYLYSERAPERIRHHVPEAKLIAILRHPADRAYSAFTHLVRDSREEPDFARALRREEERIRENYPWIWHYRRVGFYPEQLRRYYELFESAQIRVYLYEDLRDDVENTLRDIYSFLEVDESFVPDTSSKHNASGLPRSKLLNDLLSKQHPLKKSLKTFFPKQTRRRLRRSLSERNLKKAPPMPPEVRLDLVEGYREDVLKLQDLIGRDLSHWRA